VSYAAYSQSSRRARFAIDFFPSAENRSEWRWSKKSLNLSAGRDRYRRNEHHRVKEAQMTEVRLLRYTLIIELMIELRSFRIPIPMTSIPDPRVFHDLIRDRDARMNARFR